MNFQPVIPFGGFAGWSFLSRTQAVQQEAFNKSPAIDRNITYFKDNIGSVKTAEDLMADRQLLEVALGAFGLGEDINNKFFIQKVLEDGTISPDALGNRLSDKQYLELSKAFGFGDFGTPNTSLSDFGEQITSLYQTKQFETAVGDVAPDLRLAMAFDTALNEIVAQDTTENGRWFSVMGKPPVREVFEKALGLPSSIGALDLDLQLRGFRDKLSARFGDGEIGQFSDPDKREELIRSFLAQTQLEGNVQDFSGNSAALTLLQSSTF